MTILRRFPVVLFAFVLVLSVASPAAAESPARERELTCSDGTTFTGEQVRNGGGKPPHMWRNVNTGEYPQALVFFAATVTLGGDVIENVTWDNTQGVAANHTLVTCSFVIPIGPFTGAVADFTGFFIP